MKISHDIIDNSTHENQYRLIVQKISIDVNHLLIIQSNTIFLLLQSPYIILMILNTSLSRYNYNKYEIRLNKI